MMDSYTDKQNYILNQLAYANIDAESWKPGMRLVDLVGDPHKTQLKEAGLGHLEIVDYANNNETGSHSGFCAIAFRDPDNGNRGMSFRGTENLDKLLEKNQVDMADNIHTALTGDSVQKQEAVEFFEKNKAPYGDNYLFGHSKGGELASEVYAEYYDQVREMHVINPQPINPHQLTEEQRKALKSDKVDVVIIDGDTVHSLGGWPYSEDNTRIIENNKTDESFFGPHMLGSAKLDGDNYKIEDTPYADYPSQAAFCDFVQPVIEKAQQGDLKGLSTVVYGLTALYTFFVRDVPNAWDKFKEAVVSGVRDFVKGAKDKIDKFVNDFKDFAADLVRNIESWWNKNFNAGYKAATANPRFKADTALLKSYAASIRKLNGRITKVDGRLDGLYWKVGLLDMWKLQQADMLTGYSWRLNRVANYLSDTAEDLESVDRELANSI